MVALACEADDFERVALIPERKDEYAAERKNWFPRDDQPSDKREPGLFKRECVAKYFIGLASKAYILGGGAANSPKIGLKGVNKRSNDIDPSWFFDVLFSDESITATNAGFIYKKNTNTYYTYTQMRSALSNSNYFKRGICENGRETFTLDM